VAAPLIPEDPGLLASVGRYLGRFAQVPMNLLSGDIGGAFRQGADILGETADAFLPGDWIPEFSRPEDEKRASQMLGINQDDSLLAGGVDFVGETLLNPLTYLTGGTSALAGTAGKAALKFGVPFTKAAAEIPGSARALEAAGGLAKGAYGKVPQNVRDSIGAGVVNTKSALGWLKPADAKTAQILADAEAAKSYVGQASAAGAKSALEGLADSEAEQLFRVIGNYQRTGEGPGDMVSELLPGSEMANTPYRLADELAARGPQGPVDIPDAPPVDPSWTIEKPIRTREYDPLSEQLGFVPDTALPEEMPKLLRKAQEAFPLRNYGPREKTIIDPLSKSLGAGGVAQMPLEGDILEAVTKIPDNMGPLVFNPKYANDAAEGVQSAFPRTLNEPIVGARGQRVGMEKTPLNMAAEKVERIPRERGVRTEADEFTGQVTRTPVVPRNPPTMIPESNTEALNSLMGGLPATMTKVTAETAPRATAPMIKLEDQLAQWNSRIDSLGKSAEETARLKDYAAKYLGYIHNDFVQKVKDVGALSQGIGDDVLTMIPQDYAHRRFTSLIPEEDIKLAGQPSSVKARTLKENQNLRDFLNSAEGKKVKLEENLISGTAGLAGQAGRIAQRSTIAKGLLGDKFVSLADDATRGEVSNIIKGMEAADPEGARLLQQAWEGQTPRGPIMQMLANANAVFKPAAVYGLAFPRVGGIMKNILSFPAQIGLGGEGKQALTQLARTPATVRNALQEGVHAAFGFQIPKDQLAQSLDLVEQAFQQSGGRAKNASDFLRAQGRDDLAQAAENGVIDGFVGKEAIENSIRDSGWGRKILGAMGVKGMDKQDRIFDVIDAPAKAFQGAEQYARLATYLDFAKKMPGREAAAKTNELLYNYATKTGANRTLRDIIPFAAYQTNAIRQSGKFIKDNPAAGVMLGNLADSDPSEQYGWMSGQTNIPIGTSETGDAQYLTGLGLPFEALNSIPNLSGSLPEIGQELRSNLLGSSQPLVKTAYSVLTGTDPRFGSAYGSYDKLPGNIDGGAVGSVYNQLAGTGLIQPLSTPLNQIGQLIDDRTSAGDKALNFLTGTRTVNVDEDRALQQRLQQYLESNPEVGQFRGFFAQDEDPQTQALIKALAEAKKRMKAKREAQPQSSP
jgi:hypothetical protein